MAPMEQVRALAGGGSARIHDPEIASHGRVKRSGDRETEGGEPRGGCAGQGSPGRQDRPDEVGQPAKESMRGGPW